MGAIKFIGSMALILVFSIAVISYMTNFAADNNSIVDIADDPELAGLSSSLQSNASQFRVDINGSSQAYAESEIADGSETTRSGGQFKGNERSLIAATKAIFTTANKQIFGGEDGDDGFGIVITVFFGFITFLTIAYGWKLWKGGNPD